MTNFTLATANARTEWSKQFHSEYVRGTGFRPYMGKEDNAIIRVKTDLTKNKGDVLKQSVFGALGDSGVTGSTPLEGNEEQLDNYSCATRVTLRRHGVVIGEDQAYKTDIDLANVARSSLKQKSMRVLRDDLVSALNQVVLPGENDANGIPIEDTYKTYAASTVAEKDAYLVKNADRILFGDTKGGSVFATQLGTIGASDKLDSDMIMNARDAARVTTGFNITPYMSDETAGREWHVLFVGQKGFRSLAEDAKIYDANKDARARGVDDNPIFQSGDLIYNGMIIREIPEIGDVGNVGAASATVAPAFLCGASALSLCYAKLSTPRVDVRDYGHQNGVGIVEIRGENKFSVAGIQTGMVSIFHAV